MVPCSAIFATAGANCRALAPVPIDERHDRLLVGKVEARQRLIAQQQAGVVGDRLPDAQPLLLAPGQFTDGPVGEPFGTDVCHQRVDPVALTPAGEAESELVAGDTEGHEVPTP